MHFLLHCNTLATRVTEAFRGLEFSTGDFYHVCCCQPQILCKSSHSNLVTLSWISPIWIFKFPHLVLDKAWEPDFTMWLVPVLGLSCKILTGLQFANCCYSESPPTQFLAKFFFEDAVAARFWEASSSFDFSKFEQAGYERDAHWLIRLPKMPQHWNCQFRGRRRRRRRKP